MHNPIALGLLLGFDISIVAYDVMLVVRYFV